MAAKGNEQGAHGIAVGTDQNRLTAREARGNLGFMIAASTLHHILETFPAGRRYIVAAAPDVHLFSPKLLRGFRLVQTRQITVVPLAQIEIGRAAWRERGSARQGAGDG